MAKTIKQKFIIDESGSMNSQQKTVIDGFNEQLETMAQEEKDANGELTYLVSLIKFSDKVKIVFQDVPLAQVKKLTEADYTPSGGTALFDAIGETISRAYPGETDNIITIITDGHENASRSYKHAAIKTLIDLRQRENKWGFVYFGANQDAWSAASSMGISNAVNYTVANTGMAMNSMSSVRSTYTASAMKGHYQTTNLTCDINEAELNS